ncbi:hypothetical protein EB796_023478 [Bugula neritina]|uniref:Tetraspanin n=1 Tax=Bugula neritina TaxID=10212 RepID=A0A7J7IXI7_BUGNE|nr:hypothetical protein EB796_023478 [Bugula neritina]
MNCGIKCLRLILVVFNIIFFLAGAAILGVGIYIRVDPNFSQILKASGLESITSLVFPVAYVLIAFGAFTFLVGFCGCCGAIRQSKCLIGVYIIAVMLVIIAEIAGGVLVVVRKDLVLDEVGSLAVDSLKDNYGKDGKNASTAAWNVLMGEFQCCGFNSTDNFIGSPYQNSTGRKVPYACCKTTNNELSKVDMRTCQSEANATITTPKVLNNIGCKQALENFVNNNSTLLMGIGIGIAAFELLVVLSALCFCCNIDKDD